MKWPQILTVLLSVLAVALAVRSRKQQTAAAKSPSSSPPPALDIGRPLPPSFDRPGIVSRQIGLLRVTVSVLPEVALETETGDATRRAEAVPILLTFENDTYQPLPASTIGWIGSQLCTVRVTRSTDDRDLDVFQHEVPSLARADWLSAERRSVTIDWPLRDASPGSYRISVQLALPDQPALEIATRLL